MANEEQFEIIKQGTDVWNEWRKKHPGIRPDLRDAHLNGADLRGADLSRADLIRAKLSEADLSDADLSDAYLIDAQLGMANLTMTNLNGAYLSDAHLNFTYLVGAKLSSANLNLATLLFADLSDAILNYTHLNFAKLGGAKLKGVSLYEAKLISVDLKQADLREADLRQADLRGVDLRDTNFLNVTIGWTAFGDSDLRQAKGLESIKHVGPSTIGMDTLMRSEGDIPVSFLKGAGISDGLIEYARSLIGRAIEYYTCFISYSSQDHAFAERLYADLQNKGVRCWYAPEDMKTGDVIRDRIDQSIRLYDKLLLVLSEHSVQSKWVRFEVEAALDKECEGKPPVLFPVRLDDAVINSATSWAAHIQRTRHITDFGKWKQHDDYQRAFARLLRDLQPDTPSKDK